MLDLRISGRKALVCAASKGLGRACAMSLGRAGVDLTITARTAQTLEQTAEEIRKETGAKVTAIPGDISTEVGILSTGVIDPVQGVLYVVAETLADGVPAFVLHALDIASGFSAGTDQC